MRRALALFALVAVSSCAQGSSNVPPAEDSALYHHHATPPPTASPTAAPTSTPAPVSSSVAGSNLRGITFDNVSNKCAPTNAQVSTLQQLSHPTVRVVFDNGVGPSCYTSAIAAFDQYAWTMGELVDSSDMKKMSVSAVTQKAQNFVSALGASVNIWEIGNEVNGEWLGSNVPAQIAAMYSVVKSAGYKTALTLYYEPPQTVTPGYDMIPWEQNLNNVSAAMHQGVDYVLVSYYEVDNNNVRPSQSQWDTIFKQLATDFPNAKVGFGEIGLDNPITSSTLSQAQTIFSYYQGLSFPDIPRYTRAGFWWYAAEDLVPTTKWPSFFSLVQSGL